jgi:cell division protease FtsH
VRKAIGWILFIVILATLLLLLNGEEGGPRREVPLSEFRDQLLAGNVAHVSVGSDRLRGEFEQPLARDDEPVTRFRVVLPSGASRHWMFTQWLLENRTGAAIDVSETDSLLLNIFVPLIPWLLIFGFIWFFVFRQLRNANQKPKEPLPVVVVNAVTPAPPAT